MTQIEFNLAYQWKTYCVQDAVEVAVVEDTMGNVIVEEIKAPCVKGGGIISAPQDAVEVVAVNAVGDVVVKECTSVAPQGVGIVKTVEVPQVGILNI